MYLAEQELRSQFDALKKTTEYILGRRNEIQQFFSNTSTLCVLGCGSSYSTAKSSALQFSQQTGIPSYAIAAGDLLVNFNSYEKILKNATLLLLSRSGSTSELVLMTQLCRERFPGIKILSVCAVERAPIAELADINIEIPWAFDESICQTRTVTNLYVSALLLTAIKSGNDALIREIQKAPLYAQPFAAEVEDVLAGLARSEFSNAVILADSGMAGLAEEGALAFKEICHTISNFYHVLDFRHGPIVLTDESTLVIILVSHGNKQLQTGLIHDVQKRAGTTLVLECSALGAPIEGVTAIRLPQTVYGDVSAIFMLYCIQLLCLKRALFKGINPDAPAGLDPWISLEEINL